VEVFCTDSSPSRPNNIENVNKNSFSTRRDV